MLVFSRTLGYRHESIPAGVMAIRTLGARHGFDVEHSEDPHVFTSVSLQRFGAVVFLNTTGDVLAASQEAAFMGFIRGGGGFVGVHAAADTEYDWPWYGGLVGAWFLSHPAIQPATLEIVRPRELAVRCVPAPWTRTDEWYDFRASPPPGATILATIDESTYVGGVTGHPHAIAWQREYDGGRTWYTAMGHTSESYQEPAFLEHLLGGILWALAVR